MDWINIVISNIIYNWLVKCFDDCCKTYICDKYLLTSIYIFWFVSTLTNIIVVLVSRCNSKEISKHFIYKTHNTFVTYSCKCLDIFTLIYVKIQDVHLSADISYPLKKLKRNKRAELDEVRRAERKRETAEKHCYASQGKCTYLKARDIASCS